MVGLRHPLVLVFVLGTAAAAAACDSAPADDVIDMTFDVCAPMALRAPDATEAQRAAIEEAAALWRRRGFTGVGAADTPGTPGLTFYFESANPASFGYYADEEGVIYINSDLSDPQRSIVIAHELGHAFGLWHVPKDERPSVMNPGNLTITPNDADQDAVEGLWGMCGAAATPVTPDAIDP